MDSATRRVRSLLLIIGEREALAWILRDERTAFPEGRWSLVRKVSVGDELLLLTTRGCFHNPGRDRTRVIGRATVRTTPVRLDRPVEIAGRRFPYGCGIEVQTLAGYLNGVEVAPLVDRLSVFPKKHAWSTVLRRPVVELPHRDAVLLRAELEPLESDAPERIDEYLSAIKPVRRPAAETRTS